MDDRAPRTSVEDPDLDRQFDTAHLKQDLGRRTVQGAAWTMGSHSVRFLMETARIVVLARLLQPADYGLVAMVTVFTGLVGLFQDLGLPMATVTRERITHAQVSALFWVNMAAGLALALATAASAPLLAWFYGEARLVPIALVLAPSFLLGALSVQHQALLRRQMRFRALGLIRIISVAGGLAVGIFMAYRGAGYWALVGMPIATAAVNAAAVWVASRWRPGLRVRGVGAWEMIRFGSQVTGTNLVRYFSRRFSHVLLGWWWGATPLGLFTKATTLVEVPMRRAMTPIGSVVLPSLSRLADDPERYRSVYLRMLEKLALVMMAGSVFMVGTSQWLIPFLLGPRWVESGPIFGALALLGLFRPLDNSSVWLLVTQDRADEALRWSVVAALITGTAVVIGLPWGGLGVAVALAASGFVRLPLLVWYVTRRGPVRASDIYRTLATPALASGCALLALIGLAPRAEGLAPALVLTAGVAVTGSVVLAILCALPPGRRALLDVWSSLLLLRRQRAS